MDHALRPSGMPAGPGARSTPPIGDRRSAALRLFLFLAGFFIVWTFRATLFFALDEKFASPTSRAAYSDLLKFVLWVLPAAAFAHWVRGEPPTRYLGLSVRPTRRTWLACVAVTLIFLLLTALSELTVGGKRFSGSGLASLSAARMVLQLGLSPLFEEVLFRGLVMNELLRLLPPFLANALTSLLFVGAHLPFWLSHGGLTPSLAANASGVFVFSVLACWLFAKSASIWPPTLAHIANNVLSMLLIAGHA